MIKFGEKLFGKERFGGRMKGVLFIKFKGEKYLLVGDLATGGAIATQDQYDNFRTSYAHLFRDGNVRRYNEIIGTLADIKVMRGKK